MKLNVDCVRDVLLQMEKAEYGEPIYPKRIYETLPRYSEDDINYSIVKMNEAGFIKASINSHIGYDYTIVRLDDITYQGHQFLANVRENKVWTATKSVMGKIGATSLQAATQIATSVVTELVKQTILPPL